MNIDENYGGDLCKNHSARSVKEFCRVCPSNLNKKELENVYFTLLENNLDLKTTINSQHEKIKVLSTKVQRLTALQKTYLGKEPKECCGSKALINEQKECISELRRSNECLSERVRQLNMRLCSAKQFLKRGPFQSMFRCNRCSNKNVSMSALITKRSETNLRTTLASSQYLVKDVLSSRTANNNSIALEKGVQCDICDEYKCRNHIEELKRKNNDLKGELSRTKENHAAVMSRLERDVSDLRDENVRVRSDRTLAEDRAELLRTQLGEVISRLGSADLRRETGTVQSLKYHYSNLLRKVRRVDLQQGQRRRSSRQRRSMLMRSPRANASCDNELAVELAAERRKVRELQCRLRAADVSCRVADAVRTHLDNIKSGKDHTNVSRDIGTYIHEKPIANDTSKFLVVQSPPKAAVRTRIAHNAQIDETFKGSDDSGYAEVNRSQHVDENKASTYINQVLLEKIADLQNQVNNLKTFKNNSTKPKDCLKLTEEINAENTEAITSVLAKQHVDENIISESSESMITEKKANAHTITTQQAESNINIRRESKKEDGSRDTFKENNLCKTGSLHENIIINTDNDKKDNVKTFEAEDAITKSSIKSQIGKSSNRNITAVVEINIPDECILNENVEVSDGEYRNTPKDDNLENKDTNRTKDEKRKDSDSSKGTYTVHKDENVLNINIGNKDACPNATEQNKTYHKNHNTHAADAKKVLNGATSKRKLVRGLKSTSRDPRTYVRARRDVSPGSTECEISSMSDLPSERDEGLSCSRSPGEERPPTLSSRTLTTPTTTDYGSLSEGELPYLRDTTPLSEGEKRVSSRTRKSHSVPQVEATLAAVQQELSRCSRLLRGPAHRSLDPPGAM